MRTKLFGGIETLYLLVETFAFQCGASECLRSTRGYELFRHLHLPINAQAIDKVFVAGNLNDLT